MEQSIYELYMEQVNPQDTREIMQAEDTLTALLKLVENRELRDAIDRAAGRVAYLREVAAFEAGYGFMPEEQKREARHNAGPLFCVLESIRGKAFFVFLHQPPEVGRNAHPTVGSFGFYQVFPSSGEPDRNGIVMRFIIRCDVFRLIKFSHFLLLFSLHDKPVSARR